MERPYFGTVTITHYTLAKARLAARAHSRECRARPDVVKRTDAAHTRRAPGRENGRFPPKSAKSRPGRSLRTACCGAPPPATRPALAPRGVRHGLTSAGPVLRTHARSRGWEMRLVELAGWGGVDRAAQNHFLGVGRAARSSHSRMRVRSFELETSSWRKVITVRRQERCERPCQRPELQLTIARADGQLYSRDAPSWRELEQEMTIDPSIVA